MRGQRWVRIQVAAAARRVRLIALAAGIAAATLACPLPFQFSRQGWAGNAGAADPSTPDITAMPRILYTQAAGPGGTVDTGMASTASDTAINLETDTPGAVIYYTVDGTDPNPRAGQTVKFTPGASISLAISGASPSNSSASIAIKATAIGPNMKPSPVMSAGVTLHYPQTDAPVFSVTGGAYSTDQSISMTATTPGGAIFYTIVNNAGPAPAPVPGQAGTNQYAGPIMLTGPAGSYTISAMARSNQMIDSATTSASWTVTWARLPDPTFSSPGGTYNVDKNVVIQSASGATIWYTTDGSPPIQGTSPSVPSGGSVPMTGHDSTGQVTLRAFATKSQMTNSFSVQEPYLFQAATPNASPGVGTYIGTVTILSLSTSSPVDEIHYTTDGSTPTQGSPQFTGTPIASSATFILGVVAYKANYAQSVVSRIHYTVVAPEFTTITRADIASQDSKMTQGLIDNSAGNRIPVGTLLFYLTDEGNYGELVMTNNNYDGFGGFQFRFITYNSDGTVHASNNGAKDGASETFDLDFVPSGAEGGPGTWDLWYNTPTFTPYNTARFYAAGIDTTP